MTSASEPWYNLVLPGDQLHDIQRIADKYGITLVELLRVYIDLGVSLDARPGGTAVVLQERRNSIITWKHVVSEFELRQLKEIADKGNTTLYEVLRKYLLQGWDN